MTKKTPTTATRDAAGYVRLDLGGWACTLPPGVDSPEIRQALMVYRDELWQLITERGLWSVGPDTHPGPSPRTSSAACRELQHTAALALAGCAGELPL
jgi:hypothetical protein